MQELRLIVPTYVGNRDNVDLVRPCSEEADGPVVGRQSSAEGPADFGKPTVAVLIREEAGIRVVLGTHDYDDFEKPDIRVERRRNGWAIFLHPLGGSDPSGHVYFLDDGRSFLVKEDGLGPTEVIHVLDAFEVVPGLD